MMYGSTVQLADIASLGFFQTQIRLRYLACIEHDPMDQCSKYSWQHLGRLYDT